MVEGDKIVKTNSLSGFVVVGEDCHRCMLQIRALVQSDCVTGYLLRQYP